MTSEEWAEAQAQLRKLGVKPPAHWAPEAVSPVIEPRSRDEVGRLADERRHAAAERRLEEAERADRTLDPFGWLSDLGGWLAIASVGVGVCAGWWALVPAVASVVALATWALLGRPR